MSTKISNREEITEAWNKSQGYWHALITVCDRCLRASCWQGVFYCDDYKTAGTTQKSREELRVLGRENESYWKDSEEMAAQGIADDVEWINHLGARFPTHRSVQKFRHLLEQIATAHTYDPGETDLDDEQPVSASLTLGDVRLARRLTR